LSGKFPQEWNDRAVLFRAGLKPYLDFHQIPFGIHRASLCGVKKVLEWVGRTSAFGARALLDAFRRPFEYDEIIRQLYAIGLMSTPLIAAAGLALGVVMSMHTRATLESIGAEALIPAGLAISLISEIGPLTTGLLIAGRVGAGIGAELGGMRVTEQIDALEASAVDSFKYLAVTRIIACMIAFPLLTTIMNFSGLLGGFLAETFHTGMSLQLFFYRAFERLTFSDYIPPTVKTVVFGFVIGTVSSFLGYHTKGGAEGVGRASTMSVVLSSILLIVINVVLVRVIMLVFSDPGGM
jgi:phospholipid/cholesterol/gamma-HCH transport system permease protein